MRGHQAGGAGLDAQFSDKRLRWAMAFTAWIALVGDHDVTHETLDAVCDEAASLGWAFGEHASFLESCRWMAADDGNRGPSGEAWRSWRSWL
jgi:hypothetical protein